MMTVFSDFLTVAYMKILWRSQVNRRAAVALPTAAAVCGVGSIRTNIRTNASRKTPGTV